MNRIVLLGLAALAACAPGGTGPARPGTAPTPAPEPTPAVSDTGGTAPATKPSTAPAPANPPATAVPPETPAPAGATAVREAARNWQLLDAGTDRVIGIGAERAYRELLANRQPKRQVVVAVLDGGVDTAHVDLRANLWTNPKEVAGNRKDDDGNGYVDDVRGWNFLGGKDGRDVGADTYEVTRLYVACTKGAAPRAGGPTCAQITEDYQRQKGEATQELEQVRAIGATLDRAVALLRPALGGDSITPARVQALQPTQPDVRTAQRVYLQLAANGITPKEIEDALKAYQTRAEYGLNATFDPRPIVGDSYANLSERRYGNTDVTGPDAEHGTHVAGIIGAVRGNNAGVDGVANGVRIMAVRTVPDGDERDKDVANAIRYAVDNGANVINMSFGKGYSPYKSAVDEAVRYADGKGVLMVHAAGNDGENTDEKASFPTPAYLNGGRAANWIEVGASSWKGADSLAASFSNFGKRSVDVFAPGVDILSTVPGSKYERNSGTSMASPVVAGLAAMLMAYYPTLTAPDVKRIILESATKYANQPVAPPGSPGAPPVPFGTLSATGGVVNAYAAVKMAEQMTAVRP